MELGGQILKAQFLWPSSLSLQERLLCPAQGQPWLGKEQRWAEHRHRQWEGMDVLLLPREGGLTLGSGPLRQAGWTLAEPRPRLLIGRVKRESCNTSPMLSCCQHHFCPIIFTIDTIYLCPYFLPLSLPILSHKVLARPPPFTDEETGAQKHEGSCLYLSNSPTLSMSLCFSSSTIKFHLCSNIL